MSDDARRRAAAWLQLLRVSALFTVPGDALAGAAATGSRPGRGTFLAAGSSLCLYEAGMALNDWADREEDAVERPERPLPSGRLAPPTVLAAAGGLTVAGLGLAAAAGRRAGPALPVASALAATVWAYDLRLKHTRAGPAAMAAARGLDLLLGAAATARGPGVRRALGPAGLLSVHTLAVTGVSREETQGGSATAPLLALGAVAGVAAVAGRRRQVPQSTREVSGAGRPARWVATSSQAAAGLYGAAAARPLAHAALNPSPPLVQRAVGGGIRAMIPLQAALAARTGAWRTALPLLGLLPLSRRLSRKVSPT